MHSPSAGIGFNRRNINAWPKYVAALAYRSNLQSIAVSKMMQLKIFFHSLNGRYFISIFLVAISYCVLGRLSLQMAQPSGFASVVFPAAGLALALCLSSQMRLLPGVALGAFFLNFTRTLEYHGPGWLSVTVGTVVAIGSSLQAWAGAYYLQRWTQQAMDSARDILHFLFGMPFICIISSLICVPSLTWLGALPADHLQVNLLAWWTGDFIGVILSAPLIWILVGEPRSLWWKRRSILGIPMLLGILISSFLYSKTSIWEAQQEMRGFHLQAQQIADLLQARFGEHERFLQISAAMFDDDDHIVSIEDFNSIASTHLDQHHEVGTFAWAVPVTHLQRDNFEQANRSEVAPAFEIRQREGNQLVKAGKREQYAPILLAAPEQSQLNLHGVDWLAEPGIQASFTQALHQWRALASPVIQNDKEKVSHLFLTVFPNLNNLHGRDANQVIGVLSLSIRMESFLQHTLKARQFADFLIRLEDVNDVPIAVFDSLSTNRAPDFQRHIQFGGRKFLLSMAAGPLYLKNHRGWESWVVLAFCLFVTSVLGCMMLVVSGDQARIYALVSERTRHLHEREARLQAILDHAADAILTVNQDGQIVSANSAAYQLFGLQIQQQTNLSQLLQLQEPLDIQQLQQNYLAQHGNDLVLTGVNADGNSFPLALALSQVKLSDEDLFVCILRNLTEQQRSQEKIHHLAHHDPLTGLANRITLDLRLEQLLAISRRNQVIAAVMFIDIDHFKKINDSQGHQIGDLFLREVAKRLQESVRNADTIARFGGDEFIVVLAEQDTADHVTMVANRIVIALSMPYLLAGLTLHSGASVGIALFPSDGEDVNTLLRNADTAMYAAKSQGRGNFQFFSPNMNASTHERLLLENRLWEALEQNEFELFLQPQIALQTGQLVGAEALIRWRHPELGLVQPDRFIPVVEDSGLIQPVGEWVLQRGIQILSGWKDGPLNELRLALNLSARQCQTGSLLPLLDRLLHHSGIAASKLEMEITETAAMSDPEQTRELLRELRMRGIQVAIDDFGTGYSSLSYLKIFAIDRIKIDRSFVKDIETDQNDAVIVTATIALAHSLGLEVIAEGVESRAQCEFLRTQHCDEAQGYFFARPLPLDEFVIFAQNHQAQKTDQTTTKS